MNDRGGVENPEDLGRAVASTRYANNLSQAALAAILGVSQRYLSELERGKPEIFDARLFGVLQLLAIQLVLAIQLEFTVLQALARTRLSSLSGCR